MFYLFEVDRNVQESLMNSVVHMILILVSNLVSRIKTTDTTMVHGYVFFIDFPVISHTELY